jgi:glycerol kinase
MQLQADIAGIPVVRPVMTETTALGAAFAAGLSVGFWRDESELRTLTRGGDRFEPLASHESREAILREWSKGIERSLNWV